MGEWHCKIRKKFFYQTKKIEFCEKNTMKVVSVGNALVDLMVMLPSDGVLRQLGLVKGSMQLVEKSMRRDILEAVKDYPQKIVSGGSAANTAVGMAQLGVDSSYIGAVGFDNFGEFFHDDMQQHGVKTLMEKYHEPTGVSIVLVSPDGERTFATYLGAALKLTENFVKQTIAENTFDWLYVEGYLVENHVFFENILQHAKEKRLKIAMDLANFIVVERHRDFFHKLVKEYIDLLFVNREECIAFCHQKPEESISFWKLLGKDVVLKLAKDGAMVIHGDYVILSPTEPLEPVDTTGAGDLFAAGFMYGLSKNLPMEICSKIANVVAREVIQTIGAKLNTENWEKLKKQIENLNNL